MKKEELLPTPDCEAGYGPGQTQGHTWKKNGKKDHEDEDISAKSYNILS